LFGCRRNEKRGRKDRNSVKKEGILEGGPETEEKKMKKGGTNSHFSSIPDQILLWEWKEKKKKETTKETNRKNREEGLKKKNILGR